MVWLTVVKCVSLSKINSLFCDTKTREEDETETLNSNHFLENDTLVEVVVGLWGHSLKNRAPLHRRNKLEKFKEWKKQSYATNVPAALFPTGMLSFEIHTSHTLRLGSNGKSSFS